MQKDLEHGPNHFEPGSPFPACPAGSATLRILRAEEPPFSLRTERRLRAGWSDAPQWLEAHGVCPETKRNPRDRNETPRAAGKSQRFPLLDSPVGASGPSQERRSGSANT